MAKQGKNAFMRWYESYQGQRIVGVVYSVGASVVIVGALFKILHWPGASQVLMVGMFTEAFLFIIGALDKPHPVYHWEDVFPQLLGGEANPEILAAHAEQARPTLLGGMGGGVATGTIDGEVAAKPAKGVSVPSLSDSDLKALQDGINQLGNTASQLASLGQLAETTNGLSEKMNMAGKAAQQFADTQNALVSASQALGTQYETLGKSYQTIATDLHGVAQQTKEYGKGMEAVNAQMSSLNAVYELQLKEIQAQAGTIKAQTEKVNTINASVEQLNADAKEMQAASAAYLAAQQKLAAQVADLNKVYGNMLNALN